MSERDWADEMADGLGLTAKTGPYRTALVAALRAAHADGAAAERTRVRERLLAVGGRSDGPAHSLFLKMLAALDEPGAGAGEPVAKALPFKPCGRCGGAVGTWGTDAEPCALLVCHSCGRSRKWTDERATPPEGAADVPQATKEQS